MSLRSTAPTAFDNFGPQGRLNAIEYAVDAVDAKTTNQAAPGIAAIRTADWALYVGAGAPDAAVQATLDVNPTGDDNGLTFTAVAFGEDGNAITIAYVDPAANDAELGVVVTGTDIVVNLATGEAGAITSTAADVLAAIEAEPAADALVVPTILTTDSGTEDDGSGVVTAMAEAPLADGAGFGVGDAMTGAVYVDTTAGKLYINGGGEDEPTWNIVTSA